ncbi:unnamed protein product [Leptidea sinapis]|uniref:Protein SAAL1 n=1 Tax=Leptidea sinapis TaxID=189913 RepID=A0A5E4Q880_9NEOP|nr:unnamed protein product [Leptidea sinapis]
MKPTPEAQSNGEQQVTGDVIGDTAYSERFVLKILLKLANLDTLKDELQEQTFEEDLCTLWDMTAERDVVLFLLKHDMLNLLSFAWPIIDNPRTVEILIGIIANMCCQKEAVEKLLNMNSLVSSLLEYIKTDDSLLLIQLLRLLNSSIFLATEDSISVWVKLFINSGYSNSLYYILKNSSNKDLLVNALENFNTICTYCNVGKFRTDFFGHFVSVEALESLLTAFIEVTDTQKDSCEIEQLERVLLISLQIILNLVGFDRSKEIYSDNKNEVIKIISQAFKYYENKLVNMKEIDMDLVDIVDSTISITDVMTIHEMCNPDQFYVQSCKMWKTLHCMRDCSKTSVELDAEDLEQVSLQLKASLSKLIFIYIAKCGVEHLLDALDEVTEYYDEISSQVEDESVLATVSKRVSSYRTRLKESVDC